MNYILIQAISKEGVKSMEGFKGQETKIKDSKDSNEKNGAQSPDSGKPLKEITNTTEKPLISTQSTIAKPEDTPVVHGAMAAIEHIVKSKIEQLPDQAVMTTDSTTVRPVKPSKKRIGQECSQEEKRRGQETREQADKLYWALLHKNYYRPQEMTDEEKDFIKKIQENDRLTEKAQERSSFMSRYFRGKNGLREDEQTRFAKIRNDVSQLNHLLEKGFPSEIDGRSVRSVSGKNLDCYLRAVPGGAKPVLSEQKIETLATSLRERVETTFGRATDERMLNPGSPKGQATLLMMHDEGLIDLNRGFIVYNMKGYKVEPRSVIIESSDGQYDDAHAVLRKAEKEHFYAIDNKQPLVTKAERQEDSLYVKELRERVEKYKFAKKTKDILNNLQLHKLGDSDDNVLQKHGLSREEFSAKLQRAQEDSDGFMEAVTQDELYQRVEGHHSFFKDLDKDLHNQGVREPFHLK